MVRNERVYKNGGRFCNLFIYLQFWVGGDKMGGTWQDFFLKKNLDKRVNLRPDNWLAYVLGQKKNRQKVVFFFFEITI